MYSIYYKRHYAVHLSYDCDYTLRLITQDVSQDMFSLLHLHEDVKVLHTLYFCSLRLGICKQEISIRLSVGDKDSN